jgi:hypothetical protein
MSHQSQPARCAVVLRMQGPFPASLGRFEMDRERAGGDLGHGDHAQTKNNKRLIGEKDWLEKTLVMIDEMKAANHLAKLTTLRKRGRPADFVGRVAEVPKDPWRPTTHGPMREVILTANREVFEEVLGAVFGEDSNHGEEGYERIAVKWVIDNFGDDVVHAHADRDEAEFHVHAVMVLWVGVDMGVHENTAIRERLRPSKHELIGFYERRQHNVGEILKR